MQNRLILFLFLITMPITAIGMKNNNKKIPIKNLRQSVIKYHLGASYDLGGTYQLLKKHVLNGIRETKVTYTDGKKLCWSEIKKLTKPSNNIKEVYCNEFTLVNLYPAANTMAISKYLLKKEKKDSDDLYCLKLLSQRYEELKMLNPSTEQDNSELENHFTKKDYIKKISKKSMNNMVKAGKIH